MSITAADVQEKRVQSFAEGAFFETEDYQRDGETYRVYKHAPKNLIEVLQNARAHGDIEFIVYQGQRYTYTQFYAAVDALAASLQNDFGVKKGDRLAIAMRNNPQWSMTYAAATLIGAIIVPINSWGKTEELQYAVTDSGASVMVCDPGRFKLIENAGLDVKVIVAEADGVELPAAVTRFEDVVAAGEGQAYDLDTPDPHDTTVLLYTSGSTGFPKGVAHQHIAMCQALFNMMWIGFLVMDLEGGAREYKGGAERETPLLTVPLFHCTGLLSGFHLPLATGQKVVMMYKWDSQQALALIAQEKVTGMASVPAIIQDLLGQPNFDDFNTSSLIRVSAAGAATPAGLPELILEKTGSPSRSAGYGMTETVAVGSTQSGFIFDLNPEASGIVSPIMQMRSVDPDGEVLPQGVPGEIQMRGICVTPGYWQKPEANASTFVDGRWMKTGDVGLVDDDGFVHITGRIKEIVIRGGENIYPGEIEYAAYELEKVHEVVVFGEPDAAMGEEMVMVAYPHPGQALDEAELRGFLKQRLAGYKVPKTIILSGTPLPRNASEKLHKLKVKEQYLEAKDA